MIVLRAEAFDLVEQLADVTSVRKFVPAHSNFDMLYTSRGPDAWGSD